MRDGASLSSHAPAAKDGGVATAKHVRAHICEVQLLLRSTYELKIGGCHDNFVKARNMLAQ